MRDAGGGERRDDGGGERDDGGGERYDGGGERDDGGGLPVWEEDACEMPRHACMHAGRNGRGCLSLLGDATAYAPLVHVSHLVLLLSGAEPSFHYR